ncbi:hypothetical protein V2J09_023632 [Rumex salicifolius]
MDCYRRNYACSCVFVVYEPSDCVIVDTSQPLDVFSSLFSPFTSWLRRRGVLKAPSLIIYKIPFDTIMSRRRINSPGWAAFDLQQKPKQVLRPRIDNEPFPSLPSITSSMNPCNSLGKDNSCTEKSYASAVVPSVNFPASVKNKQAQKSSEASNSSRNSGKNNSQEKEYGSVFRRLKVLYSWADDSLIEDILAAVDNNFENASSSLKAMVSDNGFQDSDITQTDMIISTEATDPAELSSNLDSFIRDQNKNLKKSNHFSNEMLDDFSSTMKSVPVQLTGPPIEPEWEEDDVYLANRKDAMKIIRAASRHSKAAANSFLRGDHSSAQQFSKKAQEEWEAAEKLNQKAANEILSIRNSRNGIWKLDLHGLHAVEAVQALRERLNMIETQVGSNSSAFPGCAERKHEAQHELSSLTVKEMKSQPWIRQRPVSLEVITGIGNHSRGEAAIPAAVKSFLIDKRYRHDETRPGVMMVRPKFRLS